MPHAFDNAESWLLQNTCPAAAQQANQGIVSPSLELAVALAARDPARFAKLLESSRILLMDGPSDFPGSYAAKRSIDVIDVDLHAVAKRIASDLIQSTRSRSAQPVTFQAKWVPGGINNRLVTPDSVEPRRDAQAYRLGESRIAV
jgi:hypothetical protein